MQPETFSAMYLPRARRSGVLSKVREVNARVRGPRKGRHPTVKVMATGRSRMMTTSSQPKTFKSFFMFLPQEIAFGLAVGRNSSTLGPREDQWHRHSRTAV